jgi:plastocyanin
MSNETLFYICGSALAVSAVVTSLIGLRVKSFPGKAAPLVALWFVLLIGSATTFAVLHAQDEDKAKAAELSKADEEVEEEEEAPVKGSAASEEGAGSETAPGSQASEKGAGETLKLSAEPSEIAFDTTKLTAEKAGKVTIDFDNPSALEHDVAIEQNGKQIAISETIAEGSTSVSASLKPGTYTFLCTIPGHAEAGMEGMLVVK